MAENAVALDVVFMRVATGAALAAVGGQYAVGEALDGDNERDRRGVAASDGAVVACGGRVEACSSRVSPLAFEAAPSRGLMEAAVFAALAGTQAGSGSVA